MDQDIKQILSQCSVSTRMTASDKVRFWSKIDIKGPEECWDCKEPATGDYGRFWDRTIRKYMQAHRVSWELTNGPILDNKEALHKCDNKRCCNPGHLYLGTQIDNMCDRVERSSGGNGRSNMMSKDDLSSIKRLVKNNVSMHEVAKLYNISVSYAYLLATDKRGVNII